MFSGFTGAQEPEPEPPKRTTWGSSASAPRKVEEKREERKEEKIEMSRARTQAPATLTPVPAPAPIPPPAAAPAPDTPPVTKPYEIEEDGVVETPIPPPSAPSPPPVESVQPGAYYHVTPGKIQKKVKKKVEVEREPSAPELRAILDSPRKAEYNLPPSNSEPKEIKRTKREERELRKREETERKKREEDARIAEEKERMAREREERRRMQEEADRKLVEEAEKEAREAEEKKAREAEEKKAREAEEKKKEAERREQAEKAARLASRMSGKKGRILGWQNDPAPEAEDSVLEPEKKSSNDSEEGDNNASPIDFSKPINPGVGVIKGINYHEAKPFQYANLGQRKFKVSAPPPKKEEDPPAEPAPEEEQKAEEEPGNEDPAPPEDTLSSEEPPVQEDLPASEELPADGAPKSAPKTPVAKKEKSLDIAASPFIAWAAGKKMKDAVKKSKEGKLKDDKKAPSMPASPKLEQEEMFPSVDEALTTGTKVKKSKTAAISGEPVLKPKKKVEISVDANGSPMKTQRAPGLISLWKMNMQAKPTKTKRLASSETVPNSPAAYGAAYDLPHDGEEHEEENAKEEGMSILSFYSFLFCIAFTGHRYVMAPNGIVFANNGIVYKIRTRKVAKMSI